MTPAATATPLDALLDDFRGGRRIALARAISMVENERKGFQDLLEALHPHIGGAHRIGITGPPGAGKSTLVTALIERYLARDERIGVVAIDPSSPYTGGALLGDRIRMNELATDPGVFIRSMASRGSLGGLALATTEVADVMDAFGFDRIIIETIGVGQAELDIAGAADSTTVVLVPESGDAVQAMKAGLMEISDLFVINKADRPGAERLAREVEQALRLGSRHTRAPGAATPAQAEAKAEAEAAWEIPVLRTVAETGEGVDGLLERFDAHRSWLEASGELVRRRRARVAERLRHMFEREVVRRARAYGDGLLQDALDAVQSGTETPYAATRRIADAIAPDEEG